MDENQAENAQEVEQSQEEATTSQEEREPEAKPEKTTAEINWEQARNALQMQKQEIEELKAKLAEQSRPIAQEEPDELADLDPSDYVTVEKAQKLAERKAKEAAKKIVSEYVQQQSLTMDEQRMRAKHEDYDYVIETYAIPLIKQDPALAYKIQNSKNPAETAYKLGKLSDNYEEKPVAAKENPKKAEKILKNASRPVSGNALGSPLKSQADQALKMSPQQVWEMSQKYARGG